MKEKLSKYVDLLFAGTSGTEDIQQEILQNTLDRYEDLISQGKSPEAAYQLAILGIGDISEILGKTQEPSAELQRSAHSHTNKRSWLAALGIAMFVICPIPVLLFQNEIGVALLLIMVALGVVLCILDGSNKKKADDSKSKSPLRKSISSLINVIMLTAYFIVSFATMAWHITWIIFPIGGAVDGFIGAMLDLMEVE